MTTVLMALIFVLYGTAALYGTKYSLEKESLFDLSDPNMIQILKKLTGDSIRRNYQ